MSDFNSLYITILENEIFKASTPEEGIRRKQEYARIIVQELVDSGKATRNPDGSYDVKGSVDIGELGLTRIPVRFNKVSEHFSCSGNKLTTLDGCPRIVNEGFNCHNNNLVDLVGGPKFVGGWYNCYNNHLTSVDGAPQKVGGGFRCYNIGVAISEDEIRKVCQVTGPVYVDKVFGKFPSWT